jgi:hypothetical protein
MRRAVGRRGIIEEKIMIRIALATIAALSLTTAAQAGSCAMTSATGLGVTKDIAMFMSNKALKDMTAKNGEKGSGKVTTTCDGSTIVTTTCVSKQRTCK